MHTHCIQCTFLYKWLKRLTFSNPKLKRVMTLHRNTWGTKLQHLPPPDHISRPDQEDCPESRVCCNQHHCHLSAQSREGRSQATSPLKITTRGTCSKVANTEFLRTFLCSFLLIDDIMLTAPLHDWCDWFRVFSFQFLCASLNTILSKKMLFHKSLSFWKEWIQTIY